MRPILIYQMGKVGSTSVQESLYAQELPNFHIHDLFRPTMDRERHVAAMMPIKNADIITLTRDVIARNISSFFQCVDMPERAGQWYVGSREQVESMPISELIEAFFNCPQWKHEEPLGWFDNQLKRFFDIDVYATPFEVSKGWQTYQQGETRCLLLRMESMSALAAAVAEFFSINVSEQNVNRAQDHWYGSLYRQFLDRIVVPDSYLDTMYGSQYMKHFYSDREIKLFRAKWSKKLKML